MRIVITVLILVVVAVSSGFAQQDVPLIERKSSLLQNQYYILGKPTPVRQVVKLMKPFETAHQRMKSSRRFDILAMISAGLGFSIIGAELISAESSGDFDFAVAGLGLGFVALAVPISIKSDRRADEAIDLYNRRQLQLRSKPDTQLGLVLNAKGLGVRLNF